MNASRLAVRALTSLCVASGVLGLTSVSAFAATEYAPALSFGSEGSGNGQFIEPTGVAVNSSSEPLLQPAAGDVYVVDTGNARVQRFSSDGTYVSQWNGTATLAKSFSFSSENDAQGIAVDGSTNPLDLSAGDVYVADVGHRVIDQFNAEGVFTGLELSGTCAAPGTCPGKEIPFPGELRGIAVDTSGDIWVYESEKNIDEFSDTGGFVTQFNTNRGTKPGLAVDVADDIFPVFGSEAAGKYVAGAAVAEFGSGVTALTANQSNGEVLLDKGNAIERFAPEAGGSGMRLLETFAGGALSGSQGIAVNGASKHEAVYASQRGLDSVTLFEYVYLPALSTQLATVTETGATLHGTVESEGEEVTECQFEYGYAGSSTYPNAVPCAPKAPFASAEPVSVSAVVSGLQPDTAYHFRLTTHLSVTTSSAEDSFFTSTPPLVKEQSVSGIGSADVTLGAELDAAGLPATYRVEYGTTAAYGASTSETSLGASQGYTAARVSLTGLEPATEYHFRFVATNALGAVDGPDTTFATSASAGASASSLPDERVYELVSTSGNAGEVYVPTTPSHGRPDIDTSQPFQASTDGQAIAYMGDPPFTGGNGNTGAGEGNQWLATRAGEGWTTTPISPTGSISGSAYQAFSGDLATGYFESVGHEALASNASANCEQVLYSRALSGQTYVPLFEPPETQQDCAGSRPGFVGATADGSQVLFQSGAALTPNAEVATEVPAGHEGHFVGGPEAGEQCMFGCNLYDVAGGRLRLVNVLPGPEAKTVPNATFGGYAAGLQNAPDFSNAISTNGTRIFWTDTQEGPEFERVYVQENGTSTVPVSTGAAEYWTASPDGRYAFYTEAEQLWRFDTQSNTRELLSGHGLKGEVAGVQGVIGTNQTGPDSAYVYFVATGVLASNETTNHESAQAGEDNLYLLHEGATTFVGTLSPLDDQLHGDSTYTPEHYGDWIPNLGDRTAEVTADGHHLVFESQQPLTGYHNYNETTYGGEPLRIEEVYVYAADTGRIACTSCSLTGEAPPVTADRSETLLPISFAEETRMRRWISADGTRVFFETHQPLVPQDSNGVQDVYEWEQEGTAGCPGMTPASRDGGCVSLLSSGESQDFSFFVEASESGNDVFLATRSQLVLQDRDEKMDLYDARVDGSRPSTPPLCSGAGCQGVPPAPPIFATPSSVTFGGVGNFEPAPKATVKPKAKKPTKCRKGFTRKSGKCVKKKVKRTVKKAGRSGRRSKRGRK